jgi:glycosyltransferase involved in cell wall biosynthesis
MLSTGFPRFPGDLFGSFVLELARELVAQGAAVTVVAPHQHAIPRAEVMDGVCVRRFAYAWPLRWQRVAYGDGIPTNLRRSWVTRCQVPLFLGGFLRAAQQAVDGADVVHCHWSAAGLVGYWATRRRPRPVVLTVRGSDLHLQRGVSGRMNAWVWRRMDRVIAVSQDLASRLVAAGVPATRTLVVRNGVAGRFAPLDRQQARTRLGLPSDRHVILFVGLLVPVKGVDVLLAALRQLADPRSLCVLVGDGSERAALAAAATAAGLGEQVHFAGAQPSTEIPWWMGAADVLVLPSRSEGRPNVVLEAQACGLPVIATHVGGTPELIEHQQSGWLVPPDQPGVLAAAVARLRDDPQLAVRLGTEGRARLGRSDATWTASARQTRAVYSEVLAAWGANVRHCG